MNKIIEKRVLAPSITLIRIENELIAKKAQPGQFVMLRIDENGERIPLTISDYDSQKGQIALVFQEIGKTTKLLGELDVGDEILDLAGPLGNPTEIHNLKKALVVGGGLGTALIYTQVREMQKRGTSVDVIIGARNQELVILKDELSEFADNVYVITDDGSSGRKGLVTDLTKELIESGIKYDRVIAVGPLIMMKFMCGLTKEYGIPTTVSMNPIMIDGTGMCGGCRLTVGNETKFACVDGPEFDGHLVDFDEAMRRQNIYKTEEKQALENHKCRIGRITEE